MRALLWIAVACAFAACGGEQVKQDEAPKPVPVPLEPAVEQQPDHLLPPLDPHPQAVLIQDATIMTAAGHTWARGWIRLKDGRIADLGEGDAPAPEKGERVVEAKDQFVTPGIIDTHSHLGVYPVPDTWATEDGNEMTNPITAGVRAEDAFWPQDPSIQRAVEGGVTTIQVLPGSGNLMGGHGVVLHLIPRLSARDMRFPGAKDALKMACGENPKRVYGQGKGAMPMSRMGNIFLVREKWLEARRYRRDWEEWRKNPDEMKDGKKVPKVPPKRDLVLETLADVLDDKINVHIHCYRADEMLEQIEIAKEMGFHIRSFHHAVEAYKIRDVLAKEGIAVSTWADWWGFKMEAEDAIEENLALLTEAGARGILHTDSEEGIQRMNQEAAKAYYAGLASGVRVTEEDALRWLTANPAWALGIDDQTGTLEKGKMADVVVWDHHPFSVYARARLVFIEGRPQYDAAAPQQPWSDFEVGR